MAAKRDLEALRGDYGGNSQTSAALTRIISSYVAALNDESKLPTRSSGSRRTTGTCERDPERKTGSGTKTRLE
jgi:hypothetical protein